MSNAAITWCSNIHPGKGPKGVLFCLADRATDHSGEDWTCYPSIADIMRWTDYSRAAVERNLQLLWREGYISRKRRRRADGRLGIYDYTLHREAEHRAALKASRATVQDIDAAMENGVEGEPVQALGPHGVLPHGPCVIVDGAMPQNDGQPCGKMQGQEPSREPSEEPSERARDLAVRFGELERAVPARVLKFTDRDRAFQAFCDADLAGVDVGQLAGCARRMAADPEFRSRKFASPLEVWIGKGQWRGWAVEAGPAGSSGPGAGPPSTEAVFDGPPELRAAIVAARGDDFARITIDFCRFERASAEGAPPRLIPRTGWIEQQLRKVTRVLADQGVVVEGRP